MARDITSDDAGEGVSRRKVVLVMKNNLGPEANGFWSVMYNNMERYSLSHIDG